MQSPNVVQNKWHGIHWDVTLRKVMYWKITINVTALLRYETCARSVLRTVLCLKFLNSNRLSVSVKSEKSQRIEMVGRYASQRR